MAFFGLHQGEMSKLRFKIVGNLSNGKGSEKWTNIDLEVLPRSACMLELPKFENLKQWFV